MLDRYWHGHSDRISPEAPVPVVNVGLTESRPGGAANVALNIAELGASVTLMGIIGDDEAGAELTRLLEAKNIHCDLTVSRNHPTTTKLRVISQHQQLIRADFEDRTPDSDTLKNLEAAFLEALPLFDVIIFSDYGKGTLGDPQPLLLAAKEQGAQTIVDPKSNSFHRYAGATLITPNFKEFQAVLPNPIPNDSPTKETDIEQAARGQLKECVIDALLITRGADGMTLVQQDAAPIHLPTHALEVFDVTGAGDTVVAMLGLGLASNLSLPQAITLANTAAGIVVGKLGTATVHLEELNDAIGIASDPNRLSLETLKARIKQAKLEGDKIVVTNGCFDLLHPGHIEYLTAAKKLGDRLIVLINDDESVRGLKGPSRPINPLVDRMAMLNGLKPIDWVIPFSEETPAKLIAALQPDCLVKGGDYQVHEIAGADTVLANGGEVKIIPFKPGYSSSRLIQRIQASHTPQELSATEELTTDSKRETEPC